MLITAWFIVRFDLERQHFHHRRSEGWKANGEVKRIGSRKISQQSTENQSTKRWLPFCLVCGCEAKLNCKFKHFHFACGIIDPSNNHILFELRETWSSSSSSQSCEWSITLCVCRHNRLLEKWQVLDQQLERELGDQQNYSTARPRGIIYFNDWGWNAKNNRRVCFIVVGSVSFLLMNRLEWKQNPLTIHQSQLLGVNGFRSHISFYSLQSNQKLGGGITLFSWPNGSRLRENFFHAVERSQTMQKYLNLL